MDDGALLDDPHLQTFDSNDEQFYSEALLNDNCVDDMPLVDWMPQHVRMPSQKTSLREIDLHEVTHPFYADWCEVDRRTKAKDESHTCVDYARRAENVVQAENVMDASAVSLIMVHVNTGYPLTVLVKKMGNWPYAVQAAVRYLSVCGDNIILQGNAEENLQRLLEAISKARPEGSTVVRPYPPHSHQPKVMMEKMHDAIDGQVRVLLTHIQHLTGKTVIPEDRLFAWAVRHAGWIVG
eukprot:15451623-Alexandrium_andersonii.AAC.1